jgi:hypothetical protein
MRFLKIPAFLGAAVAATAVAAWAYIAPPVFNLAPGLAQDASDMHNYIHSAHPGTLSGFASHDYDDAMDDLAFELQKLSLGVTTEAAVKSMNQKAKSSFNTFKQTIELEGLLNVNPTLKSLWNQLKMDHMTFQTWFKVGARK